MERMSRLLFCAGNQGSYKERPKRELPGANLATEARNQCSQRAEEAETNDQGTHVKLLPEIDEASVSPIWGIKGSSKAVQLR
jgi:hypothetical protein